MTGAPKRVWARLLRVAGRVTIGVSVVGAIVLVPAFGGSSGVEARGSRGRVTVAVVGGRNAGPACVTLRDLTKQMVVGSYCDGDVADLNLHTGRIELDLPQRSFAIDVRVPGASVTRISPQTFDLGSRQSVVVRVETD
jgi:hypothetical protein